MFLVTSIKVFLSAFSGIETRNEDLYTTSLIPIFKYLITLKSKLDNTIIKIEAKTRDNKENFCWVLFLRKADRIAIIKSSLLVAIALSTQST